MIKLTLKGLAKYVASGPAAQRKILQDFKYPAADEPFAMRVYYRDAIDCLREYIRSKHPSEWLRERAIEIASAREGQSATSARRLRQNAQAVLLCEKHFRRGDLELLDAPRLRLNHHGVSISVVPDLCVKAGAKTRLLKIQFGGPELPERSVSVITQCLLDAAASQGLDLPPSSALYVDLPRGVVHTAPRVGKRALQDIRAACETIAQIWESIPPPLRSKRSAAA